jgi:hypothetical protein
MAGDWGDTGETPADWSASAEPPAHGVAEVEGAQAEAAADAAIAVEDDDFEIAQDPLEEPAPPAEEMAAQPQEPWHEDAPAGPAAFSLDDPEPTHSETTDPVALETTRFAEPPGQEAQPGWTPLSPADEGTLASVGVDPNDGAAALRTLAALVRVLQRRQLLDADELAAELRDTRAPEAAAQEPAAPSEEQQIPAEETAPPQDDPLSHEAAPHDFEGSPEV